jgi:sugar phosphate isomerase/epimerase
VKPTLALSTSWSSVRHADGYAMLHEMADMGFTHVELSHGVRISLVPGLLKALEEGVIKVSSTHNFCPLPTGIIQAAPNLYEPSSFDYQEHSQWVRHTKRSIDFAAQVGSRVLVMHLGRVQFFWFNPARTLRNYLAQHPQATIPEDSAYQSVLLKAGAKLRKKSDPYWKRSKASLAEIFEYAVEKNIRIGVENREKFDELPLDNDIAHYFESLPPEAPAGYWHDTGHANIKHRLGVIDHQQHLEKMDGRIIGFHLHDVNTQGQDHQAIGAGGVDFKMISRFWRPEQTLVLELSPRVSYDEVKDSKARIEDLFS